MRSQYIVPVNRRSRPLFIGNKANNLRNLASKGFRIPQTYACTWKAYDQYIQGQTNLMDDLASELRSKIDPHKHYAIRSSANLEDGQTLSFAGQFGSILEVSSEQGILDAIRSVWDTTQSMSIQTYMTQRGAGTAHLKMAVIIQEMVPGQVSGVAFSKNPYSGLDEVLVEAVLGTGLALVQEGITPFRWVNKWGTWTSVPDYADQRDQISIDLIEKIVQETKAIARIFKHPVDLEWVYDGEQVFWVQMREITTLDIPIYSNRLSNEVFPGLIKPLIWSVNVPLVNGAWMKMFTELIGPNDIEPESLAGRFYGRAYFNMAAVGRIFELMGMPAESLELLIGIEVDGPERPTFKPSAKTFRLLPSMLRYSWDKLWFSRKIDSFLPHMQHQLQTFSIGSVDHLNPVQLIRKVDALTPLVKETAYYNTIIAVLMRIYDALLKQQLAALGVAYDDFDLTAEYPELDAYDPASSLARMARMYHAMDEDVRDQILATTYTHLDAIPDTDAFRCELDAFLQRFGHLSDSSSDFSRKPWREDPDLILNMVINYVPVGLEAKIRTPYAALDIPWQRRLLLGFLYKRARSFRLYREAISSLYTYGYGLFRYLYLALGRYFTYLGLVGQPDDIFYLFDREVRALVNRMESQPEVSLRVQERKNELEKMASLIPPAMIFGDVAPVILPARASDLKGVPTSRGYYTGPVRVVHGIQDFERVQDGDVLVIPYSDVGWTPLFARAGAVISESGGMLSHSAIIAREYGIPAVVSVPGACQLADDIVVSVDGHTGLVTLHDE